MSGKRAQFCCDFEDCSPATAGKTERKWDFSPVIAADPLLQRRLLCNSCHVQVRLGFTDYFSNGYTGRQFNQF